MFQSVMTCYALLHCQLTVLFVSQLTPVQFGKQEVLTGEGMTGTPTADPTHGNGGLQFCAPVLDTHTSEEHTPIQASPLVQSPFACPAFVLEWVSCRPLMFS